MSSMSPSSVLFSSDGYELAVIENASYINGTRSLLIGGINTANKTLAVPASFNGQLGTAEMSNVAPIQTAAVVTASGSSGVTGYFFGTQEIALVVNVGTVTGAGSIQYTIQEVDPGDGVTVYGNSATTAVINTGNTPGVFTAVLNVTTSSNVIVTWTVTGSFSATIYSTVTTKGTPSTQVISGSITASNPSVGTDNAAALGFDTQVGGIVTLNNPTYTAGNLRALSLTTEGGLRVFTDGYVTTAAPSYTNNTSNALSLTTAGELRVLANQGTSPWVVSGTVTANQGTSPWVTSVSGTVAVTQSTSPWVVSGTGGTFDNRSVGADAATALGFDTQVGGKTTTAAPTYTTGNLDALSLTTLGGLRIDGVYAVGTANATAADVMNSGGYVTTAAPTYTTGQLNPLSLDTAGNLRIAGTVTTNKAATTAVTSVAASVTNVTLLASNASRVFATIYNTGAKTVYIKLGTTASTTSFTTQLFSGSYWEVPNDYTGQIDAIWAGTGGAAVITEATP